MKRTELILIGIAVLALLMKFLHLPASGILTVLSLSSISVIYMYLGFALFNNLRFRKIFKKESYKEISTKRIIGGVGAGLALSVSAIGILFKFQSWPGASVNLIIGIVGLTVVTIISLIKMQKNTDNYYSNILKRVAGFGAICIFLLAIPTKTWLGWKFPNNPEYVQAVIDAQAKPNNQELWQKVDEEREKMYDELNK
jgi:hypothetical protein